MRVTRASFFLGASAFTCVTFLGLLAPSGALTAQAPTSAMSEVLKGDEPLDPVEPEDVPEMAAAQDVLRKESARDFANAWIDDVSGMLTVGVAEDVDTSRVEAALAHRGVEGVSFEKVARSQAELDFIVENVYELAGMDEISSAMHDYEANRIILTSHVPVTDSLRAAVFEQFGDAAVLEEEPLTLNPATREADTSPFYAGAWMGRLNAAGPNCTLGFSWLNANNQPRLLTAGHCYRQAENDTTVATDFGAGDYTYKIGRTFGSTADANGTVGSDGDLVLIDTTDFSRSGAGRMWTQGPTSDTSTNVKSVDQWTSNGTAVCYSGMKRGVQCGECCDDDGNGGYNVQDANYSYEDSTGDVWTHVARATKGWGKCTISGDSGSPVYINTAGVGVAAHGILNGGGGGGDDDYVGKYEPTNCSMVFTEIGQAYEHWSGGSIETS